MTPCLHQPRHIGGECDHCIAKRVLATSADAYQPGDVLHYPSDRIIYVIGNDVKAAVEAWHDAWRKKL